MLHDKNVVKRFAETVEVENLAKASDLLSRSKQVILDALTDVGGLELSSRFASVKKGDLAMSAERVFAGTYITEVEVRERALAWVPEVMRFADQPEIPADNDAQSPDTDFVANDDNQRPSELAA